MNISNLITECLNIDTNQIDMMLVKYGITLDKNDMKRMLQNCLYHKNFDLLQEMIAQYIFECIKDTYKDQLEPEKFQHSYDNCLFVLKYDGIEIKGKMHLDSISKEIREDKEWEEKRKAPREFHLTEEDKKILLDGGVPESELDQIEWEANVCQYTLENKTQTIGKINREDAIKLLGRERWLWGIHRTAFHWSTSHECLKYKKNQYVCFESGLPGRYN